MNPQAQNAFLKTLEEPPAGHDAPPGRRRARPPAAHPPQPLQQGPLRPAARTPSSAEVQRRLEVTAEVAEAGGLAGGREPGARAWRWTPSGWWTAQGASSALRGADPERTSGRLLRFAEDAGGSARGGGGDAGAALGLGRGTWRWRRWAWSSWSNPDLRSSRSRGGGRGCTRTALHRRFRLLDDALVAIRQRNASPRLQLERMLIEMRRGERARARRRCWRR